MVFCQIIFQEQKLENVLLGKITSITMMINNRNVNMCECLNGGDHSCHYALTPLSTPYFFSIVRTILLLESPCSSVGSSRFKIWHLGQFGTAHVGGQFGTAVNLARLAHKKRFLHCGAKFTYFALWCQIDL